MKHRVRRSRTPPPEDLAKKAFTWIKENLPEDKWKLISDQICFYCLNLKGTEIPISKVEACEFSKAAASKCGEHPNLLSDVSVKYYCERAR